MDTFNLIFSSNGISVNKSPSSSTYLLIKITLDHKHKTIFCLDISYYVHELIFSHTVSNSKFFHSLDDVTGHHDIFTNIYSYTIGLPDTDIETIKSTCKSVYNCDYDLAMYFIFGISTFIAFIILLENNIVPVQIYLPHSLDSGKIINRNTLRLLSLPLIILKKITVGIMYQLVESVQMFSNFWDVVFSDGPIIPLDIQSRIYFDMIDIYTNFLYNETQKKFDDLFHRYEEKLSTLHSNTEDKISTLFSTKDISINKPYIRDLSLNTNKYYNPKNHRTRTGRIPPKPQTNILPIKPLQTSKKYYKHHDETSSSSKISNINVELEFETYKTVLSDKSLENSEKYYKHDNNILSDNKLHSEPLENSEKYYKHDSSILSDNKLYSELGNSEKYYKHDNKNSGKIEKVELNSECQTNIFIDKPVKFSEQHSKYDTENEISSETISGINQNKVLNVKLSQTNNNFSKDNEIICEKIIQNTGKYIVNGRNSDHRKRGTFDFNWVSESTEKDTDSNISSLESRPDNKESIGFEESGDAGVYSSGPQIYFS